jgi:poly-gamma-glutamate synthesis protein (capsule biosynthesis protein)
MDKITVRLGGDVMLGGSVLDQIRRNGPTFPFTDLSANKGNEDLFFCNLECTLSSDNEPPYPNGINLHSAPEAAEGLRQPGINVVSLANNHAFDFGLKDFRQTQQILRDHNICTVGGGATYEEASQATFLKLNNMNVAFLAYCTPDTGCKEFATTKDFGVADPIEKEVINKIAQTKAESDIVIVSLHWGEEFRDYPKPQNRRLARKLIDHGATIVIGHHSHVLQGYERYNNGLILYDLGSIVFGDILGKYYKYYLKRRRHREGMLVDCRIGHRGVEGVHFIPTWINTDFQASLPSSMHAEHILRRWEKQSRIIASNDYELFYFNYIKKLRRARLYAKAIRLATHPRQLHREVIRPRLKSLKNLFTP